jgi:hypothetical protein
MLTPGNHKLGRSLIWGFGLPSGTPDTCPGLTDACRSDCYAVAVERYRPTAAARYRANLRLSRRLDFARRVRAFLVAHAVRVVRVHVGGDFYSAAYAGKWLRVMRKSPRVLFYFYTRSWRVPEVRRVIDRMAALPNCRAWYSADRDTGLPPGLPPRARVAWLMTSPDDLPPPGAGLVFRVRRLRRGPAPAGVPACPAEDGVPRPRAASCDRCGFCWRPDPGGRFPLAVLAPESPGRCP